jgi:hypothetical protein
MARFDFRLEDQDSHHYREGSITITDEELEETGEKDAKKLATKILEEREQKYADYRLTTEELTNLAGEVHADAEARDELADKLLNEGINTEGFSDLPGIVRGTVAVHHQAKPYKLVSITKRKGT